MWLIERVNEGDLEDTIIKSKLDLTDGLIEKITNEVINNPRIVEDEKIEPGEIEWTDMLIADAGIVDPLEYSKDIPWKKLLA